MLRSQRRYLLTPGPLTTSSTVREAMLQDWGSWDDDFKELTADIRARVLATAGLGDSYACVPIQGSGTFAIEAALLTLVGQKGMLLVLVNGAYGRRMVEICRRARIPHAVVEAPENANHSAEQIERALAGNPTITHIAIVQCETSSGILNRVEDIARIAAAHGIGLIVDAMSAFGVLPIDPARTPFDALIASTNKCLHGVPGAAFVIAPKTVLAASEGRATSLSLDLHDQWRYMEQTGQWRFTPPTHVLAAFRQALIEYEAEGGQPARLERYRNNCRALLEGLHQGGLRPLLQPNVQSPIIVTFLAPDHPAYDFAALYAGTKRRGFVIYPGKMTLVDSFRIGCIGDVDSAVMRDAAAAVLASLRHMGVS